ncbi:exonuclease sbcCD subunit D [Alkalispirochaeta sphaeroplastigenens]|uniref:Nuclease SbcCD subunit D n=1 Tax=Alkalispirochaeta sphaeroplastigenens TaxID=1187066 RepID=A0A2S4K1R4_9SPIO|nr:exonuclease SbcCD subunit D C-terminal domain-containing protein [Alkalispirochaeta sphaeroplastigenens]POR05704.1 exonuclease sbcCD subunit D [Alkalispirochaeta sphaeroplastigenens]
MRVLHTADWHIGRSLYGRQRYEEFQAFLDWLVTVIGEYRIDLLLVAGDIFDTTAPSHRAQELYYRFLCRVAASSCRHVVIVAGNHDSPSFLNAPRELLKALSVHVVGRAGPPEEELLVLEDPEGSPELLVCAVPYLRDRDLRIAEAGEQVEEKERKLLEGLRSHYDAVTELALETRASLGSAVPLIATGHLFAAGGTTIDGDGVRDLYVGTLAQVPAGIFSSSLSYVALGHLHVPQTVGGRERCRYSGSPLPMGFGEATQQKSLCLVTFPGAGEDPATREDQNLSPPVPSIPVPSIPVPSVELIPVPVFQRLARLQGDWPALEEGIRTLAAENQSVWLEVVYEGNSGAGDLRRRLEELAEGTALEVLRVKNARLAVSGLERADDEEEPGDLDPQEVFLRCLALHDVPRDRHSELLRTYREALTSLHEADHQAE